MPPLRLRRHTGPLRHYEKSAADLLRLVDQLSLVRPGDRVLDIGCGTGVMAPGLLERVGAYGAYVGFDVHAPAVHWCRCSFAGDSRCRFEVAELLSPYAKDARRGRAIESYSFPVVDGGANFVIAKSVFTHLPPSASLRYLQETRRVLTWGRGALVTAFLFEPGSPTARGESRIFRFSDDTGHVRWRRAHRPEAAIAYERRYFVSLIETSGLRVQWICPGFLPGGTDPPQGQDVLLLGH